MDWLVGADWRKLLVPDTPLLEIAVRGTVMYLALFVLLRIVVKRQAGAMAITDLLVIVLIADAAQNAMAGDYTALPDGVLLVGVILFWAWFLDWLGYHVPRLEHVLKPHKLPVVRDGRMLRRQMEQELITEEELRSQLRLQGVDDLSVVKVAYLEPDGRISVICHDEQARAGAETERRPA